jgi:very-short-patch-repair endonuclease
MNHYPKSFDKLNSKEKHSILEDLYLNQKKSFADIAAELDTYPNKIRREILTLKIPIRDKSDAQKNALKSGKHKHPTKGQNRSEDTKNKIGVGVMKSWDSLDEDSLNQRKLKAKEAWDKLDEESKQNMIKLANDAVRATSKTGSKLEKFVFNKLLEDGYKVEFHKEQSLLNTKLQIDLFLPTMNIAIEIDGPSHFLPVWGEDALQKNINYDQKKEGLILGKGLMLIRIKQTKDFSKTRSTQMYSVLKELLDNISNKKTNQERNFTIED